MDRFQPSNSKFSSEDPRLVELTYELTQLLESGQAFDLESSVGQHPQHADELRRIYPAIRAMVALAGTGNEHLAGHKGLEAHPLGPLGDYLLIRPIGRGGMGVVYEAEQMSLARRVAVKILPFASLWTESALERFRNEVRIAAMLEHPNIVPIYGMGCERGVHFYAMKLVDGCSLSDVIGQRKLQTAEHSAESPSAEPNCGSAVDTVAAVTTAVLGEEDWCHAVARLGKEAATALAFAHQQGVIHRDIKPSNLLLDRQGRLIVADFGLARFENDVSLTRTGDLLGTPRYMSPEQASGSSKQLDPRTDIYSLGATLYEMLTLRPVISGPSRAAAIRQLQDLQVAAPRTHDANIPQPLEQIVLKCLHSDPSDRYTTAAALVEDLGRFQAGQPVLARAPSVVRRTTRWIQRHPQTTLGLLTVLVLCSLISTASFWMTHQGWLGSSPQRGPPGGELVDNNNSTTIPSDFESPEESPDMLRSSRNNRNGKNNKASNNYPLGVEKLEGRELMAGDVSISISDASAVEGSNELKTLDRFLPAGSDFLRPRQSVFGPDGNGDGIKDLYLASADTDEVLRYDGKTGAFIDVFVTQGSGGLDGPADLEFGPDGKFYVSGFEGNHVLRYNGATGEFLDQVASGLSGPIGLTFGADGSLFIASHFGSQVFKYNGSNLSVFVPTGSGGLNHARNALFGPDSNGDGKQDLYVASGESFQVLRYDGTTGAFIDVFATVDAPAAWMEFGPNGDLYVGVAKNPNVDFVRFDVSTGAIVDKLSVASSSFWFTFDDNNVMYNPNGYDLSILRHGPSLLAAFKVTLSSPSTTPVTVSYATSNGSALAGSDFTAASGTITFAPGQTSQTILVKSMDDASCESTETFTVILSNSIGAAIADGTGVGTILDNDPFTKFYVVNDASTDRTYEYGTTGSSVENYALSSGNTAPRGAASTAAGDKVWVVDANKKVYVYDTNGSPMGNWTAGSLSSTAQVEGIATNGTDVWIVDARQDRVYRYANAASALTGNINATSFPLNNGNKNPKDIVTDGTHLWVVNDSTTDKVFKYTTAGAYVGSWTITTPGATSPTGITLDPSNVSHLWIVDNVSDRVYQYDAAVGLTSGSKSANSNWILAPGNINPQGIADPPPPNSDVSTASLAQDGDNTRSVSAIERGFMQAPIVSFGLLSTERVTSLQSNVELMESVDETMSQLISRLPVAPMAVTTAPSLPLSSPPRIAMERSIDLAFADDEFSDSLRAIAKDLLESTRR